MSKLMKGGDESENLSFELIFLPTVPSPRYPGLAMELSRLVFPTPVPSSAPSASGCGVCAALAFSATLPLPIALGSRSSRQGRCATARPV